MAQPFCFVQRPVQFEAGSPVCSWTFQIGRGIVNRLLQDSGARHRELWLVGLAALGLPRLIDAAVCGMPTQNGLLRPDPLSPQGLNA